MNVTVIKGKNGLLSASDTNKTFLIGFHSRTYAKLIARTLPPSPLLKINRYQTLNIGLDVKFGLSNLGVATNLAADDIYVDVDAKIDFPRLDPLSGCDSDCDALSISENGFELDFMSYEDFMMLPFEKNLGIMMPLDIVAEHQDRYIFSGHLVEASFAPNLLKEPPTLT